MFFEFYDGTIGSAIVEEIKPDIYTEYNNTLPYSDPRVKAMMKELKKQDKCAGIIREFVNANTDVYSIETIAAALGQVAKEYGYEEE